jgi:hypothetical protein
MNVLFANALRFDFRGDLAHLDVLKSLPMRPAAIVLAQLVAPTVVLTACQLALFLVAGVALHVRPGMVAMAMVVVVPLNALVFAIENFLFLVFPVRTWAMGAGDLQGAGRRMIVFVMKTALLIIAAVIAASAGILASILTGNSVAALTIVSAAVLTLETAALLPLTVTAFRRYDPSAQAVA